MAYNFKEVEKKWQEKWEKEQTYKAENSSKKPKYFCLIEFPYPSGAGLHVGHPRSYTAMDIIARKKRMEGNNVLFPIGWDAFGLPAEQYAVKTGVHPAITTKQNIETFKRQLKSLGFSFDWSREVNTTDPEYYKWTQWIFLQFFKHNLAYKKKMPVHWCPSCKTVLANEESQGGVCERCGTKVEDREKEQWMLAITKYADRLIDDLDLVDYIEPVKIQQRNWIGRSAGINYKQKIKGLDMEFEAFDSVPQTFMAQTFAVIAPEHTRLAELIKGTEQESAVTKFVENFKKRKKADKFDADKEMEGIFTGRYVENPFGTGDLPIWVASFVIADYGSGFVNCSAHDERDFEFAKKYNIPLKPVMFPEDEVEAEKIKNLEYCYHHDENGILAEPVEFKGRKWGEARDDIINYIEKKGWGYRKIQYKLRDWIFSRQRYWGEPIPLVNCVKCGWVPLPEKELPLLLPQVEEFKPTDAGESPLANAKNADGTLWVNTVCPKCGGNATRETDTMPNWAGSSWYFYRYTDPNNNKSFADSEILKYWIPVDWYNGGMEHTTLHLLYSRFWHKFLWDIGAVPKACGPEPYKKRTSHGLILAQGGEKMSKSKGNVVNPDDIVEKYGADVFRVYEMFIGPFDQSAEWQTGGLEGSNRFLNRIWNLYNTESVKKDGETSVNIKKTIHKTVKAIGEDINRMGFNTAVAKMMELLNVIEKEKGMFHKEEAKIFAIILSPFAPHVAEEIWSVCGFKGLACEQDWPVYDKKLIIDDTFILVVQINGKVRDQVEVDKDISEADAKKTALGLGKVIKWLEGKEPKKIVYVKGRLVSIVV